MSSPAFSSSASFGYYTRPLVVIIERLARAAAPSGTLFGLRGVPPAKAAMLWKPPSQQVITEVSAPTLRFMGMSFGEQSSTMHSGEKRNIPVMCSARYRFELLTPIAMGWLKERPELPGHKGHINYLEDILDAVDDDGTGQGDSLLGGAVDLPLLAEAAEPDDPADTYYATSITFVATLRPYYRGRRACAHTE